MSILNQRLLDEANAIAAKFDAIDVSIGLTPQGVDAVADGTTDDSVPFQTLSAEDQGHAVHIPSSKYRISAGSVYRGLIKITGDSFGQNPGSVDGVSYPYPTFFNGSVIYPDANVTGLEFQPFTSETDVATVTGDMVGHETQQSAYGSILEDVAIVSAGNGAAHALKRGIYSRTRVNFRNLLCYGHGAEGVRIEATSDIPDGHAYGNANGSILTNVESDSNAGDGFYFGGRDINGCVFLGLGAMNNGGYGFQDHGLLGNVYVGCRAEANTSGSFKATSAVAYHSYFGCYIEPGTGQLTDLTDACSVIGGLAATQVCHPVASPAFVLNAGDAHRKGLSGTNYYGGGIVVRAGIGRDPSLTAKCALWFGSDDDTATMDAFKLTKDFQWTGIWTLNYSAGPQIIEFVTSDHASHSLTNGYALGLPNGLYMGTANSAPRVLPAATAAPVAGTYLRGDVQYNSTPSAGGFVGWVCVSAGSPGTWKTFGAISA